MNIESITWQIGSLIAGSLLTALFLATGHWFPWVRRLSRVQAYVYGTASIWGGFALWRILNRDLTTPAGLLLIASAAGATVIIAYKLDEWVRAIRQAEKAAAADPELQE